MVQEASNNLRKLAAQIWQDGEQRDAFVRALSAPADFPSALIWVKERPAAPCFALEARLPFQAEFVDIVSAHERPGAHTLHEQGFYYCLDVSSVFAASTLLAVQQSGGTILDMCSSPGGKGVFAWRALSPVSLVCNEVIGKRHAALVSNLRRLGLDCRVASLDSKLWAENHAQSFDLVICDVPCSGQSLVARGRISPGCFHPATINMNSNRQKRILANSAKAVAPGGFLAYMTCTFSRQENEAVIEWLLRKFSDFSAVDVAALSAYRTQLSELAAYRLWPQSGIGAGAFTCLLRRSEA